ncbi:hypothetical protein [Algoriella sp.]|uniref:hypothetical protein n=1 Tax=Algoriella sp. TaxID=1872434 RepID=UPI002FC6AC7C
MRNLFYSLIALCSLTAFGQEKTYTFDKKVSYKISVPDEYSAYFTNKDIYFFNYISKDALLGTFSGVTSYYTSTGNTFNQESFFIQNNRVFNVYTNSLENRLSIKVPTYYEGVEDKDLQPYDDNFIGDFSSINNLNSTQTINGYTCNEFEIISKKEVEETKTKICVDQKNQINNIVFLVPKANLKGLLIRLDDGNFNGFTINEISNSSAKISFDDKKEIEKFNVEIVKSKEEYQQLYANAAVDSAAIASEYAMSDNRYDDPLIGYYSYATSENENVNSVFNTIASLGYGIVQKDDDYDGNPDYERTKALKTVEGSTKQIIKQYKKNGLVNSSEAKELNKLFKKFYEDANDFKLVSNPDYEDAAVAADSAYAEAVDALDAEAYEPYTSTYKTDDISVVSLAIENPDVKEYLKVAPKHCTDLKTKIPTFSDKDLGNLVYNYVGQTCDLYIYESGSVSLSGTINALRKSVLEINNKSDKLTKDDKEKLTTFLNSLD